MSVLLASSAVTGLEIKIKLQLIIPKPRAISKPSQTMSVPRTTTTVTKLDTADDITTSAADINSDGKVTSSEARSVLRFSAKLAKTIES